jgi:hypothetical protein
LPGWRRKAPISYPSSARRRDRLAEALGAIGVTLSPQDIAAIERAEPKGAAAGSRYAAGAMADLDSEK